MIKSTKINNNILTFLFSIKESDFALCPNVNLSICQVFFKDFEDYLKKEYQVNSCESGFFNTFKTTILGEKNTVNKVAVIDKNKICWEYRADFSIEVPLKETPLQNYKTKTKTPQR
jgi:hypothetical protein